MNRRHWFRRLMVGAGLVVAATANARGLDVEIWSDRGHDGVYQPGDGMEVRVRTSEDAYLVVYEIDTEGRVALLHPDRGMRGYVEGRTTIRVPSDRSNLELVVDGDVGQGYLVALATREPIRDLPWYLRPYDPQAREVGYVGGAADEEGVTSEGRIVGDPFVAMERIRRRVVANADDPGAFASAYTAYYVHHEVRYPRYLCNDCHRPGRWAWWDGFDPYYAHCSVFDFRVNRGWHWGPSYWYGFVPYYYYVYRTDCPPRYRAYSTRHLHYSSWDGWRRWSTLWGGSMQRFKSDPPADYQSPVRFREGASAQRPLPPGFLSTREPRSGGPGGSLVPVQRPRSPGLTPGRVPRDSELPRGRVERGRGFEDQPAERGSDTPAPRRPSVDRGPVNDGDGEVRGRGSSGDRERRAPAPPRIETPRPKAEPDRPPKVEKPRDKGEAKGGDRAPRVRDKQESRPEKPPRGRNGR